MARVYEESHQAAPISTHRRGKMGEEGEVLTDLADYVIQSWQLYSTSDMPKRRDMDNRLDGSLTVATPVGEALHPGQLHAFHCYIPMVVSKSCLFNKTDAEMDGVSSDDCRGELPISIMTYHHNAIYSPHNCNVHRQSFYILPDTTFSETRHLYLDQPPTWLYPRAPMSSKRPWATSRVLLPSRT